MILFTKMENFTFNVISWQGRARTAKLKTPHGVIQTPAFIPVGTQATLKGLTPEQLKDTGAQAILANAYHLYLRPGTEVIEKSGGLGKFMGWSGPTFTDSGGFQVMSLGSGLKKIIDMSGDVDQPIPEEDRLAKIDNDGVTFKSHLDGSQHRFTPEISMQIQNKIGADIIFAFDELTTLLDKKDYQVESLKNRTHPWAERSLIEHMKLQNIRGDNPKQALFGVIQGAHFEDLRRHSAKFMAGLEFDGFGLGGALTKKDLGNIISWMVDELPEEKPRHMLGISEPDDIFEAIENGADTFDCVSPARVARNGALYTKKGRINITNQRFKNDFGAIDKTCDCYTCKNYTKAYLHHLFKARELLSNTLATIHNERFIVRLVDEIRYAIDDKSLDRFKKSWLKNYYNL
jgi:queuine tRNA-ribosyltransferase